MRDYSGKRALIVGVARSGIAAAILLESIGAIVTITDVKTAEALAQSVLELPKNVEMVLGGHDDIDPDMFDLAVISPGVPWDASLPSTLREAGVETVSEIELAATLIKTPIIAITGSNGKSTVTALTGAILEKAGFRVFTGGNIGAPLSLAASGEYDWVVAEVSSFQLEGIKTFRPKIAVLLNITPDHLDRHKTFERYSQIKKRIYENQSAGDVLIVNGLDSANCDIEPPKGVSLKMFAVRDRGGAWVEDSRVFGETDDGPVELFSTGDLLIAGAANLENAMAAAATALSTGALPGAIGEAATSFPGLPHRMEKVAEISGVTYINDSKGTNVDATVKSLSGYTKKVALIAGGSSKGSDYAPLAAAIRAHCIGVVLIGQTAKDIKASLADFTQVFVAGDLSSAIEQATSLAEKGGVVLFSPASASFDMFDNFEARGDAFRNSVKALIEERKKNAG